MHKVLALKPGASHPSTRPCEHYQGPQTHYSLPYTSEHLSGSTHIVTWYFMRCGRVSWRTSISSSYLFSLTSTVLPTNCQLYKDFYRSIRISKHVVRLVVTSLWWLAVDPIICATNREPHQICVRISDSSTEPPNQPCLSRRLYSSVRMAYPNTRKGTKQPFRILHNILIHQRYTRYTVYLSI